MRVEAGALTYERRWWLKAEEAIVPAATLPADFESGQCLRGQPQQGLSADTGAQVRRQQTTCGDAAKQALFMHPPYKTGVGYAFALYGPVDLPKAPAAVFRCQIGKADGSDPGDGILFRVAVVGPDGKETAVAEKQWIRHAWTPLEADLSRWAGHRVRLKLVADVGPADNSSGDRAAWAEPRIESALPVLRATLHDQPVALRRAAVLFAGDDTRLYPAARLGPRRGDRGAARRGDRGGGCFSLCAGRGLTAGPPLGQSSRRTLDLGGHCPTCLSV